MLLFGPAGISTAQERQTQQLGVLIRDKRWTAMMRHYSRVLKQQRHPAETPRLLSGINRWRASVYWAQREKTVRNFYLDLILTFQMLAYMKVGKISPDNTAFQASALGNGWKTNITFLTEVQEFHDLTKKNKKKQKRTNTRNCGCLCNISITYWGFLFL